MIELPSKLLIRILPTQVCRNARSCRRSTRDRVRSQLPNMLTVHVLQGQIQIFRALVEPLEPFARRAQSFAQHLLGKHRGLTLGIVDLKG